MSIACYCHLTWPFIGGGKVGIEEKKHPESMHTHTIAGPAFRQGASDRGEYHFPMVADVSSHYFITYSKTPRICRMTKCCEQNDISESWKKMLKLHFPVLLAKGIIPIIRSHKWPSYHKRRPADSLKTIRKAMGLAMLSANNHQRYVVGQGQLSIFEGAWDIYNKPKKSLIIWCPSVIHLISIFKTTARPKRKKNSSFVIIADWHP